MTSLTTLMYQNAYRLRTHQDPHGNTWFVAKDVCNILEIKDTFNATRYLDQDEKGTLNVRTLGGQQSMTTINESGLYALIIRSRKPEARKFRKWITAEVLPSIRRTGSYHTHGINPQGSLFIKRTAHGYKVGSINYIDYRLVVRQAGLSTTTDALYKRRVRHPEMFLFIEATWYVRQDFMHHLRQYQEWREGYSHLVAKAELEQPVQSLLDL